MSLKTDSHVHLNIQPFFLSIHPSLYHMVRSGSGTAPNLRHQRKLTPPPYRILSLKSDIEDDQHYESTNLRSLPFLGVYTCYLAIEVNQRTQNKAIYTVNSI